MISDKYIITQTISMKDLTPSVTSSFILKLALPFKLLFYFLQIPEDVISQDNRLSYNKGGRNQEMEQHIFECKIMCFMLALENLSMEIISIEINFNVCIDVHDEQSLFIKSHIN